MHVCAYSMYCTYIHTSAYYSKKQQTMTRTNHIHMQYVTTAHTAHGRYINLRSGCSYQGVLDMDEGAHAPRRRVVCEVKQDLLPWVVSWKLVIVYSRAAWVDHNIQFIAQPVDHSSVGERDDYMVSTTVNLYMLYLSHFCTI